MGIVDIVTTAAASPGHQLDGVRGQLGGGPLVQEAGGGVPHLAGNRALSNLSTICEIINHHVYVARKSTKSSGR